MTEPTGPSPEHQALDAAVRAYVASLDPDGRYFTHGWVLAVAALNMETDDGSTFYMAPCQRAMPYYARLGLLQTTIDDMVIAASRPADD